MSEKPCVDCLEIKETVNCESCRHPVCWECSSEFSDEPGTFYCAYCADNLAGVPVDTPL